MDHPPFIDLDALTSAMGGDEALRPLLRLCKRARLTQSCRADLAQAESCLSALDLLPLRYLWPGSIEAYTVEGALIYQTTALYARATDSNPRLGERGGVSIYEHLSEQQRADHEAIVAVRNRALAHVYPGEEVAGEEPWHIETLFAIATDEGVRPACVTHRVLRNAVNLKRLRRQVPVASKLMLERFHLRMRELTEFLSENADAIDWAAGFFDPVDRFGSESVVRQMLDAEAAGWGSFVGQLG